MGQCGVITKTFSSASIWLGRTLCMIDMLELWIEGWRCCWFKIASQTGHVHLALMPAFRRQFRTVCSGILCRPGMVEALDVVWWSDLANGVLYCADSERSCYLWSIWPWKNTVCSMLLIPIPKMWDHKKGVQNFQPNKKVIKTRFGLGMRKHNKATAVSFPSLLSICYFKLSICYFKLSICYFKLSICYFKLSICYFELSICYFELSICYFKLSICYSKLSICYNKLFILL